MPSASIAAGGTQRRGLAETLTVLRLQLSPTSVRTPRSISLIHSIIERGW
jgi:hypothetical protein